MLKSSINDQDIGGCTPLMFAAKGAGSFASRRGNTDVARKLLALGADPLICDRQGRTALGHAIASNDTGKNGDITELLQEEMLSKIARREFESRNSHHFDNLGNLRLAPRNP